MYAKLFQPCLTFCDPMDLVDCSPPGSSIHEIIQARILECFALPSSRGSSRPRDRTHVSYVSCVGRQVLTTSLMSPVLAGRFLPPEPLTASHR